MNETVKTVNISIGRKMVNVICIMLCIILSLMLVSNVTIIVKGILSPERPPAVLGVTPMVVLSGSMAGTHEGHIEVGDLIFIDDTPAEEVVEGDVIAFLHGKTVITHRVIEKKIVGDIIKFRTKGDANNTEDEDLVNGSAVIGKYKGRIPKLGDFALFLQTPLGMVIFVGVPLFGFVIYDVIRRQKLAKKENEKTAELEAEIERLKKLANKEDESEE